MSGFAAETTGRPVGSGRSGDYGAAVARGRPRNPRIDTGILEAVGELVAEGGYDAVNIDAVAARCGVARTTVYRRWSSPAELVLAAFANLLSQREVPDTGSLEGDLRALAASLVDALTSSVDGPLTRAAVSAAAAAPGHFEVLAAPAMAMRREAVREIVDRARRRGETVPAGADTMVELLVGAVYLRYLVTGQDLEENDVDRWLDCLKLPGTGRRSKRPH